jgi:Zn-dependent protease with chaperone function
VSAEPGEATTPPAARLNPFVFPSDTTFRFLLLVVAVIGANLYVWNWLYTAVGVDRGDYAESLLRCSQEYRAAIAGRPDLATVTAASEAQTACYQDTTRELAWWMLGGTGLLLAVAALILVLLPRWIERRRDLRPLSRDDAPSVVDELDRLSGEAELRERPRWVWSPLDPSPTGLAFGRPGRHAIALNGGLVTRHVVDPPAFRAVVRHELAHLRNRDVDLTYATISLWYAFLLVGVAPFIFTIADEPLGNVLSAGWRLLALALLVYLTRNAVLRAREVYADIRASVPDGREGALRRILAGLPEKSTSLWRRLWRVHPDGRTRLAMVNDTRRLFPLGLLVAFGTGIATTVALESMVRLFNIFVDDPIDVHLLAAAVFAPLAMGAVGIGIWRGSWGRLAEAGAPPSTWPLALAFAAGLLLGPELALERTVSLELDAPLLRRVPESIPWIFVLVAGLGLLLAWVAGSAQTWIRALGATSRPTLATAVGLVFGSGILAIFVGMFFALHGTRPALGFSREGSAIEHALVSEVAWVGPTWLYQLVRDAYTLIVLTKPVVFVALVALWLFPLAAWLRRREQVEDAPWAFLERGGQLRIPLLGRGSLDPWLVGLVAGLAFLGVLLVLRLGLKATVDADTRSEFLFPLAFFHWQLLLALLLQAVAAAVAAARWSPRDLSVVAGIAAAFTTGVVATAGIVVGPSLAGCIDPIAMTPGPCAWQVDAGFSWFVLRQVVAEGAVAALVAGLVVLGVQAVLRQRQAPVPVTPPAA